MLSCIYCAGVCIVWRLCWCCLFSKALTVDRKNRVKEITKSLSRTNDLTLLFKLLASFQQPDVDVEYCHSWQPVTQPVQLFLWGPREVNCLLERQLDLFICTEHVSSIKLIYFIWWENSFCVVVRLLCWPPVATRYVLCAPSCNEFSPGILLWSRSHSVL